RVPRPRPAGHRHPRAPRRPRAGPGRRRGGWVIDPASSGRQAPVGERRADRARSDGPGDRDRSHRGQRFDRRARRRDRPYPGDDPRGDHAPRDAWPRDVHVRAVPRGGPARLGPARRRPAARPPALPDAAFRSIATGIDLRAGVPIHFSEPMDPTSVAAALTVEPPTAVELHWSADRETLTVQPSSHWPAGTYEVVTVEPGALAVSG